MTILGWLQVVASLRIRLAIPVELWYLSDYSYCRNLGLSSGSAILAPQFPIQLRAMGYFQ